MKKILVILMLGAGFVTVASADERLDCPNNPSNQCCIDVSSIQSAINRSTTQPQSIKTTDNYTVVGILAHLTNDGTDDTKCKDMALSLAQNKTTVAYFQWQPGEWVTTIAWYSNGSSANKDNVIPLTPLNPPLPH